MRFFCAAESRHCGEAIFGTVAQIRSWVLLEYPSAWRRDALQGSRLIPDATKEFVRRAADRCLLIRRDHTCEGPLRCFYVNSCSATPSMRRVEIIAYDQLPQAQVIDTSTEAMYAVCTHGRHDKCCSKFGLPVFCALRDSVGERAWQCSHVGGDRFAGNVVVFPHGLYYGRVTPEDVPELVRHTEAGEVWMPGYRGRSCFTRAVQVAEYFARRESGLLRIDEFLPLRTERLTRELTRVELHSKTAVHLVEFRTHADAFRHRLSCHAEEPSDVPQYELVRYSAFPE